MRIVAAARYPRPSSSRSESFPTPGARPGMFDARPGYLALRSSSACLHSSSRRGRPRREVVPGLLVHSLRGASQGPAMPRAASRPCAPGWPRPLPLLGGSGRVGVGLLLLGKSQVAVPSVGVRAVLGSALGGLGGLDCLPPLRQAAPAALKLSRGQVALVDQPGLAFELHSTPVQLVKAAVVLPH